MNGFKTTTKRLSAMLLAALLMLSSVDYGILSVTAAEKTEAACQNHAEHTADCGYVEAVEGAECTHEHTDECYSTVTECVHEHGAECYEKALTCENAEEGHEHTDECYTEALICTHVCSEESGCISRKLDCKHVHDESCGYVEAVEGQPCTHSCELCSGTTEEGTETGTTDVDENVEENVDGDVAENAEENVDGDAAGNVEEAVDGNLAAVQTGDGTPVANATAITTWAELQTAFKTSGDYVLGCDVESTDDTWQGVLEVPTGVTVTLDLAGHKIDRSLDTAVESGRVMKISGTLTVNDSKDGGIITGGNSSDLMFGAAAVCIQNGGSFTLNGGSICGNKTSNSCYGTGVAVVDGATFTMNGGSICHNAASGTGIAGGVGADTNATVKLLGGRIENNSVETDYSGGLFFYGNNVTVGGSIVIENNTAKGGITSNVRSSGTGHVLILSKDMPLTADAKIGWTVNTWDGNATASGTPVAKGEKVADYLDNFFPDQDSTYTIGVKADDAETIYIATSDSTVVSKPSDTPVEKHEHDGKTFKPWSENNIKNLGNGNSNILAGSYYLTEDVKATTQLIASGIKVDICLNGHTFDLNGKVICLESGAELNIYDCDASESIGKITNGKGDSTRNQKGGAFYVKSSTLNLYGGSIEENNAEWGGAIFIDASEAKSTVNMYGGVIQNNTAQYGGGGIEVENGGSVFNMYGGSIVNNTVTSTHGNTNLHKGGGVHFAAGEMSINGKVNITGNQVAGKENNAYLRSGVKITIDLIEEGSRIGVSSADVEERKSDPVVITSGYGSKISSTDIKYFFMDGTHDKTKYALLHSGTELQIKAHSHEWKYVAGTGDNANKLYAYCDTSTPPQCGYYRETCTSLPLVITAQSPFTHTGSAYDGAKLSADELFAFNAATGNNLSDADIVYYTDADCTKMTTTANGAAGDGKAPVNEGTYYAAITVGDATAKAAFTIGGAAAASVTVKEPTGQKMTFNGTAQALVTAGSVLDSSTSASAGTMEYQVAADASGLKDDGWSADIPTATKVGKYLVYYRAVVNSGYALVDYTTSGYPSVEAEITKAAPDYTAPAAVSNLTYNGKSQQLITAGTTEHGMIQYSLDGTIWKTEVSEITGTKAGEYTVYWKLVGDDNHEDVAQQEIEVIIQKATPTKGAKLECIVMSSALLNTAKFDGCTMKGVDEKDLPGTFKWKDGTKVPGGDGEWPAVFTPTDTTNYEEVEVQVYVNVYHLPSVKITVEDKWWNSLLTTITFGIYHTKETDVKIEGTVGGYAIDKIYYYIDTTGSTTVLSAGELEGKWKEYDSSNMPKVKDPDKNVIYAKVTDKGGNASDIICSNGIIIDSQAPGAAVTINGEVYTTSDTPKVEESADLVITIADQGNAGLESATATYQKAGDAAGTDITLTDGTGTVTITTPGEYTLTLNAKDKAGNVMAEQVYHFTLAEKHSHTWKYRAGAAGSGNVLYAYCGTEDPRCEHYGESYTGLPLTITAQSPVTYSGSAYSGAKLNAAELTAFNAATGKTLGNADIVYYTDEGCTQKTTTAANGAAGAGMAPVNAGTYYAAVTVDGAVAKVAFTIEKASATMTEPAAENDLTYNGSAQELITAGATAHGTIRYRLDGAGWTTDASEITGTKAGEYTVYWKLVGDANHKDVAEQEIKVTIQKAEPSEGTVPECIIMSENPLSSNAEFDGYTMKGVDGNDLPGTFGWKDGTIVPTANGTQTAVFRPEDATNYKDVEVSVNVKIYYLPSAKITVKDDWWNSLLTTITFGIYHTEEKDVVIEGTVNADGGYDINGIYYYIDTTGSTEVLSAGELADKWQEYDGSNKPKVKASDKNVIYARVTDEGGNAVIICSDGIIIDSQAPGAAVTINGDAYTTSDAPVVRNSADLVITIADQGSAGLQDATAVYRKAGEADGTDIALTDGAGKATITAPGEYTLTLKAKDKAGNAMDAQVYHFTIVKEQSITLTGATVKDAETGQTKTGYVKGDKVIITADEPEEGDVFDHWEAVGIELDDEQKKSSSITITIPDNGITISAVYRDATAPAISGIKDGGSYCGSVTVTVTDKNLDKVTVDGVELTPDANGRYTIAADNKSHVIEAKDAAGNSTTYKISVYEGHDFGNLVYSETGRDGDMITEEAPCAHGCDKKVVRKRTAEGDVISQEYPGDSGSNGSLATEVKVEAGTPATSVTGLNIEVAKAILNAAELSQVENGENLLVYLKVNKLGEAAVPAGDKTKTEEQAAAISNLKQGVYLDLSMWKKIGTADEVLLVNAETSQELKITVALPEELKAPSGKVRTYYVIRVHDGVVTVLPAELNGDELSFKTNMFSTYSIWYTENNTPAPPSGGDDTPGSTSQPSSPSQSGSQSTTNSSANSDVLAPKTGDESNMALWSMMLLLSAVVLAGITAKWKKDRGSVHN